MVCRRVRTATHNQTTLRRPHVHVARCSGRMPSCVDAALRAARAARAEAASFEIDGLLPQLCALACSTFRVHYVAMACMSIRHDTDDNAPKERRAPRRAHIHGRARTLDAAPPRTRRRVRDRCRGPHGARRLGCQARLPRPCARCRAPARAAALRVDTCMDPPPRPSVPPPRPRPLTLIRSHSSAEPPSGLYTDLQTHCPPPTAPPTPTPTPSPVGPESPSPQPLTLRTPPPPPRAGPPALPPARGRGAKGGAGGGGRRRGPPRPTAAAAAAAASR